MKTIHVSLFSIFWTTLFACTPLFAQDGHLATVAPPPTDGEHWHSINTEAWDSFASFDADRMFGFSEEGVFAASVAFETLYINWGKKVAGPTFQPQLTYLGTMFGGESYTTLYANLPVERDTANSLYFIGGWKYKLTPLFDVDIGGNIGFYDKRVYGPGIPSAFGYKRAGNLYIGLIGRTFLQPAAYVIYEPILDQTIVQGSVFHAFNLSNFTGIDGLGFEVESKVGLLNANRWNANKKVNGGNWRNSYIFWENKGDVVYRPNPGLTFRAGIGWALNNDGSGNNGIGGLNLGPENNVWFRTGVGFAF